MKKFVYATPLILLVACGQQTGDTPKAAGPVVNVAPPAGTEWVTTVVETPDGGVQMGNPNAPIKLVEYGSLSCSHCAEFSEKASEPLKTKYIATGKVSYEFRSYLLGAQDIPSTLLIQCAGPNAFFPLLEQVYEGQKDWMNKLVSMTPAEQQALSSLPQAQQFAALAKKTELDNFVRQRGVPAAKAEACLADAAAVDRLVKMRDRANTEFNLTGTPTFLINGQVVPKASSWEALEPALKAAGA